MYFNGPVYQMKLVPSNSPDSLLIYERNLALEPTHEHTFFGRNSARLINFDKILHGKSVDNYISMKNLGYDAYF